MCIMHVEVKGQFSGVGSLHVGPRDQTQVVLFTVKHPYPLSHLIGFKYSISFKVQYSNKNCGFCETLPQSSCVPVSGWTSFLWFSHLSWSVFLKTSVNTYAHVTYAHVWLKRVIMSTLEHFTNEHYFLLEFQFCQDLTSCRENGVQWPPLDWNRGFHGFYASPLEGLSAVVPVLGPVLISHELHSRWEALCGDMVPCSFLEALS